MPESHIKPPDPGDPMFQQYERLPNFIKGADGNDPNAHVRSDDPNAPEAEDVEDESFGGGLGDPSTFTADS